MKEVKSNGTIKTLAESSDLSKCSVVSTSSTNPTLYPGPHYNLGKRSGGSFSYSLADGASGVQWKFSFETGTSIPEITHPAGVKIPKRGFKIQPNQRIEVNIEQVGNTYKWLCWDVWECE